MEEDREYLILAPNGDILAGPFATVLQAQNWVLNSYQGAVLRAKFGTLHIAWRRKADPSPMTGLVAVFNSVEEVPREAWNLQASGDVILCELPHGFVGLWIITGAWPDPECVRGVRS